MRNILTSLTVTNLNDSFNTLYLLAIVEAQSRQGGVHSSMLLFILSHTRQLPHL